MKSSSFASKAARKATENSRLANVVTSTNRSTPQNSVLMENKENIYHSGKEMVSSTNKNSISNQRPNNDPLQQQLDKVVESVANATKRLSQASTNTTNSSKRKSQNHVGPWRLGRTLGRGSTGRVRLLKHSITGQLAAVKIVPKLNRDSPNKKLKNNIKIDKNGLPYGIEREIIIMKVISHPNIMALYDVWENKNELYLVLEYIEGGELFDYLVRKGKLEEKELVTYFKQIISGLQYCHRFNICHRDLKPENLLLDKSRKIKIADFGMATLETTSNLLETSCGSPHYASPEIVAGKNYHGGPSDIWSAGIILFALLTGRLPFDDPNIRDLLLKVQAGKFKMPANLSQEAKDLIWKMLRIDPRQRITIDEILRHPLLNKYEVLKRLAPVNDFSKIDLLDLSPIHSFNEEILKNLQTLWHGVDIATLKLKLSSEEKNSEKVFYQLLKNHLMGHQQQQKQQQQQRSALDTIPRSTSIVTTTLMDANGETVKTITQEVPLAANHQRKPLGLVNPSTLNVPLLKRTKTLDGKKQVISASSSYRKPKSFKAHKRNTSMSRSSSRKNMSRSTSKKSVRLQSSLKSLKQLIQLQQNNATHSQVGTRSAHPTIPRPPLPEVRESRLNVMDFMYLCDEIFGKDGEDTSLQPSPEKKLDSRERELLRQRQEQAELKAQEEELRLQRRLYLQQQEELLKKQEELKRQRQLQQLLAERQRLALEEDRQRTLLLEKQQKAREELRQLEIARQFQSQSHRSQFQARSETPKNVKKSLLDPTNRVRSNDNAAQVLNKFGVRMSRFGNLREMADFTKPVPQLHRSASSRHSNLSAKSASTKNLHNYLKDDKKKDLSIYEFNRVHRGLADDYLNEDDKSMSFEFSIKELERMPISPVEQNFFEPRYYSVKQPVLPLETNCSATINTEDRFLDADTILSSTRDPRSPLETDSQMTDEEMAQLVNAISQFDFGLDDGQQMRQVALSSSTTTTNTTPLAIDEDQVNEPMELKTSKPNQRVRASIFSKNLSLELPNKYQRTGVNSIFVNNDDPDHQNKILRLSIYEDPDTTVGDESRGAPSEDIQEVDHESLLELVDMDHYDKINNNLKSEFVTKPVEKSPEKAQVVIEEPKVERSGNSPTDDRFQGKRKHSVRIKNFFGGERKFYQPKRELPKLPSYKTFDFDEIIELDKKAGKKSKSKVKSDGKSSGGVFLKKLLKFF